MRKPGPMDEIFIKLKNNNYHININPKHIHTMSVAITIKDWRKDIPGRLADANTFMFNKISSVHARGKQTEWRIIVRLFRGPNVAAPAFIDILDEYFDNKPLDPDIQAWIKVLSRVGEGKVRDSVPTIIKEGKNKNRANETNVFCQALRNALGLYNKQLKKIVGEKAEANSTMRYPPMLAQLLKDQKKPLDFHKSMYEQRKYNGVRTVSTMDHDAANNEMVIMYGRRKLLYPGFQYIKNELFPILKYYWEDGRDLYLDGEIYKHGMNLQDISGYARREDKSDIKVNYMIYDCFIPKSPDLIYSERAAILDEIFENFQNVYIQRAETFPVDDMTEVNKLYEQFLEEGFEGAIVRLDEPYKYSYNEYHSKILLKIKPTLDGEYKIVGWATGEKGKAAEALMISCVTEEGKQFNCTPSMEIPDRVTLAKKMVLVQSNGKTYFENEYLNKLIRVYYDELSRDKVPQRARTKLERLGIDIIQ